MDAQLKKGILEMCILHLINQQPMYGYDIIKYMCTYFPEVSESTFYAILRRLNREGMTSIFYGEESNGPKRKYYSIEEEGKVYLDKSIGDWKQLLSVVSKMGI